MTVISVQTADQKFVQVDSWQYVLHGISYGGHQLHCSVLICRWGGGRGLHTCTSLVSRPSQRLVFVYSQYERRPGPFYQCLPMLTAD